MAVCICRANCVFRQRALLVVLPVESGLPAESLRSEIQLANVVNLRPGSQCQIGIEECCVSAFDRQQSIAADAGTIAVRIRNEVGFLQEHATLHHGTIILGSVRNPDGFHRLPVIFTSMDREPRSGHTVDPLQSYPLPKVIQPYTLDGAAGHQRLQFMRVHCELMPDIQSHASGRQINANHAIGIDNAE